MKSEKECEVLSLAAWSVQWKRQLGNLNRVCLWMMADTEITDDAALDSVRELRSWLHRIERLLDATTGVKQ